eukprot:754806-Pyramimonas_sp.AAC.1
MGRHRHADPAAAAFGGAASSHETCEGCAKMWDGTACGRCHWGLRWSTLWDHVTREEFAEIGGNRMRTQPLGPS